MCVSWCARMDYIYHRKPKTEKKNKQVVRQSFISNRFNNLNNIVRNPLLITYQKIRTNFQQEPYLYLIKKHKNRVALSRLRASSQTLEIERGRHDRPSPQKNKKQKKTKH